MRPIQPLAGFARTRDVVGRPLTKMAVGRIERVSPAVECLTVIVLVNVGNYQRCIVIIFAEVPMLLILSDCYADDYISKNYLECWNLLFMNLLT